MTAILLTALIVLILPVWPKKTAYAGDGGGSTQTIETMKPKSENLVNLENSFYGISDNLMNAYTGQLDSSGRLAPVAAKPAAPANQTDAFQDAMLYANKNNGKVKKNPDGTFTVDYETFSSSAEHDTYTPHSKTFGTAGTGTSGLSAAADNVKSTQPVGFSPGGTASNTGDSIVSAGKGSGTGADNALRTSNGNVIPQPYDSNTLMGQLLNDATAKTYNSNAQYNDLLAQAPGLTNKGLDALNQANSLLGQGVNAVNQSTTAGNWYFDQAQQNYTNANDYLAQANTAGDWYYNNAQNDFGNAQQYLAQANAAGDPYFNQAQGDFGSARNYLEQAGTAGDWYYNNAQNDFGNAQNYLAQAGTAGDWYYDQAQNAFGDAQNYLAQAGTAGDPWYAQAQNAYGSAESLLGDLRSNLNSTSQANQWYDDYTRGMLGNSKTLLETGQIPQPIIDAVTGMMTKGVNESIGSGINSLASRGIVNSSVTNRGLSDMSSSLSEALMGGYMGAFNSLLGGYNQTAQTGASAGQAFADTNLGINNAYSDAMKNAISLGDSYGQTGSQRVSDMLNVAGGYTNNAGALADAGSSRVSDMLNVAGGYTSNAGALADAGSSRVSDLLGVAGGYTSNAGALMNAGDIRVNNMLNTAGGYTNNAGALMNAGDTRVNNMLNIANGYTNNAGSLMDAGSQRIGDWLDIANGYNNSATGYGALSDSYVNQMNSNLAQREQLLAAIPQYYQNAMAPAMPSYDLMKTMQQDHWNSDKIDTLVNNGK